MGASVLFCTGGFRTLSHFERCQIMWTGVRIYTFKQVLGYGNPQGTVFRNVVQLKKKISAN
jgi:hypothetical protein